MFSVSCGKLREVDVHWSALPAVTNMPGLNDLRVACLDAFVGLLLRA